MLTAREIAWSMRDIERPLYISRVEKKEDHTVISYRYLEMDNTFCIPFIDDAIPRAGRSTRDPQSGQLKNKAA